ncbi:MAG: alpha/beta fold hydrolase [Actinomycetota bacterium]|nr:alpha/beta fold hydrolase [Actinomycetota bacterium]
MCPAVGSDEGSESRKAYRHLAEALTDRGIASLRIDYPGTGDSVGPWSGPDRVDAWRSGIRSAHRVAQSTGTSRVFLVGTRLGAILAAEAALELPSAGLVLWDPCPTGRMFLRQQMLLAAAYGANQPEDGSVAGLAYTYSEDVTSAIRELALSTVVDASRQPVLLASPRTKSMGQTIDAVESRPSSRFLEIPDESADMAASLLSPLNETQIGFVADWILDRCEGLEMDIQPPHVVGELSGSVIIPSGSATHHDVTERTHLLGPHRLFGVIAEPEDCLSPALTAVFLSAGTLEHCGPGRLWTDLSRSWAALGVRCVRFDISGVGDSEARPGQQRGVARPPEAIDDMIDVASALGAPDGRNLVFVGLSSGAYHALEGGLHLRPEAIIVINGNAVADQQEGEGGRGRDPRRLADRSMPALLRRLATHHNRTARRIWRVLSAVVPGATPRSVINGIAGRGTKVLCLCCQAEMDKWYDSVWSRARRTRHRPGTLNMELLPGADHSLYTTEVRGAAIEVMNAFLLGEVLPALDRGAQDRVKGRC